MLPPIVLDARGPCVPSYTEPLLSLARTALVTFRYPDKPTRTTPGVLRTLREGHWLAQLKHDGWRAVITWDGSKASLVTRNNQPIAPGAALAAELARCLRRLPAGTVLDGEWLGMRRFEVEDPEDWSWRRCRAGEREELVLFDLLYVAGRWVGDVPALERFRALQQVWRGASRSRRPGHVRLVTCRLGGYADLFTASAAAPLCEGIVLKHRSSTLLGSTSECQDNPRWLKVKHGLPLVGLPGAATGRARPAARTASAPTPQARSAAKARLNAAR